MKTIECFCRGTIGRRCVTPLRPPGPRIQTLIPVSLSTDLETPTGLRAQRSVAFSLQSKIEEDQRSCQRTIEGN